MPVWLQWTQYTSYFRYAFEAFEINQWLPIAKIGCNANSTVKCIQNGVQVLESLNFVPSWSQYWLDVGLLFGIMLVCNVVACAAITARVIRAR